MIVAVSCSKMTAGYQLNSLQQEACNTQIAILRLVIY
jgi:hypothetical protein